MKVLKFWERLGLSLQLVEETLKINDGDLEYQRLQSIYKENHESFFKEVLKKEKSELRFLWIYSQMACEVFQKYEEMGFEEEIYWDTFQDIKFWCDNYEREHGKLGLGAYDWFTRHIDMTLFRLGRLQFEIMEMEYTVEEGDISLKKGTPVINIHIPQGAALAWEECEKSIERAKKIFGNEKPYVCHSWLLYPELENVLGEKSNIKEFRKHFQVVKTDFNEREAEWRIFGKVLRCINQYPEETGLQRRAKEYLLQGNCLGNGWAILK